MVDVLGDPSKQPVECLINNAPPTCPHMKCVRETMDGERYECPRCGEKYSLHYEDMK